MTKTELAEKDKGKATLKYRPSRIGIAQVSKLSMNSVRDVQENNIDDRSK